ncbi:uncharacterized protein LOC116416230 [Nasonia vitripennis]|uniref:Uncharacterized protein n=1 Tax=Nasonia vitripennis TaxID=7425 RepID=A0A7M7Q4X0_NASVI|nr:uncharacterized protein LOC116416230 [Nasonia vitripennis]
MLGIPLLSLENLLGETVSTPIQGKDPGLRRVTELEDMNINLCPFITEKENSSERQQSEDGELSDETSEAGVPNIFGVVAETHDVSRGKHNTLGFFDGQSCLSSTFNSDKSIPMRIRSRKKTKKSPGTNETKVRGSVGIKQHFRSLVRPASLCACAPTALAWRETLDAPPARVTSTLTESARSVT